MKKQLVSGINIQFPISQSILNGRKTVETRTYPIPKKFIGKTIAIVETPGRTGKFKARVIALAVFEQSFQYESKQAFYKDLSKHLVTPDSKWAWDDRKGKWGWPVKVIKAFREPILVKKKIGIKFTNDIEIV